MFEKPRLRLGLSVLAGAVAGLGLPPFDVWPVTVFGLALAFLLWQSSESAKSAAVSGWGVGAGYFAVVLHWLVNPFFVEPEVYGWMAPFALALMAGGLALFWAGAGALAYMLRSRNGWAQAFAWATCLTIFELLRGQVLTGFPWGGLGLMWIDTPVSQLAAWIGMTGLGALSAAIASAIITLWQRWFRPVDLIASAGFLALALGAGLLRHAQELPDPHPAHVRLIQPNAAQHLKWDPEHAHGFVDDQLSFTAASNDRPLDLIIWPETAIPYLMEQTGDLFAAISLASGGVPVLAGIQRGDGARYYNSLALIGDGGEVLDTYDKYHLVPFGEYVPFGNAMMKIGIRAFASQLGQGYSAGPAPRVMDLGAAGKMQPLICFEAIFPDDIRAAAERPDWLLHVTNDAWFGSFAEPQQHFAQARMRAIEFGLPVVRVANTGVTAIVDARGDVQAQLAFEVPGYLDGNVPVALPPTLYARLGDWPLYLCLLGLTSALWVKRRSESH